VRAEGDHRPAYRLFARQMLGQAVAIIGDLGAAQVANHDIALPWPSIGCGGFCSASCSARC
jgi:hypothetical protein